MRANHLNAFEGWITEGNAQIIDNAWSTSDAMWTNRIETKAELFKYYLQEFFDVKPSEYFFSQVKKYMETIDGINYELKYNYASDWIVDLFMTIRGCYFGRFANYEGLQFDVDGMSFRLDKEFGRFGKYGKLYITLKK